MCWWESGQTMLYSGVRHWQVSHSRLSPSPGANCVVVSNTQQGETERQVGLG